MRRNATELLAGSGDSGGGVCRKVREEGRAAGTSKVSFSSSSPAVPQKKGLLLWSLCGRLWKERRRRRKRQQPHLLRTFRLQEKERGGKGKLLPLLRPFCWKRRESFLVPLPLPLLLLLLRKPPPPLSEGEASLFALPSLLQRRDKTAAFV